MKLKGIMPVTTRQEECQRRENGLYKFAGLKPDTKVEFARMVEGPDYLQSYCENLNSDYHVLLEGLKAEGEGYDAVQPDCIFDPALTPLKEALTIPVVGPLQASIHIASLLGKKFSVVVNDETMPRFIEERVEAYGFGNKLASVVVSGVTFEDLGFGASGERNEDVVRNKIRKAGIKAVEEDGADVLINACTAIYNIGDLLKDYGVPFLSPGVMAAKTAEMLVDLGLTQSKRAFPTCPKASYPKDANQKLC